MCQLAMAHWYVEICLSLIFFRKKMLFLMMFSFFLFLAFYSFWLYGSRWPMFLGGTAHGLQHGWSGLQVWVTFHLPTCALVVRGGLGSWTRKCCIVHLSPPLLRLRGVGGRGRVFALPSWACVLSVLGTGVVISWEHGPQAPSVWLVNIVYWF